MREYEHQQWYPTFRSMRFGLFVHWGLYSIDAWHEQDQWRRRVPRDEYAELIERFNPRQFDPNAWLDLLRDVGMDSIVLTTKHHDGFCLWDTRETDFNVMNTPYGRDIVAQLAEACHRRSIPLGLYYSVVDWKHPNYPNQGRHHEIPAQPGDAPDMPAYVEFVRRQVRELCTNYGKIACFWWDMNVPEYHDPSVNALIRELQPGITINDRGFDKGDFGTPERDWKSYVNTDLAFTKPTQACQSVGLESWGHKLDEDYYSDLHLMQSIDKILAKDGCYLLNIGPKADGTIEPIHAAMLRRIGKWFEKVREAFDDVTPASSLTDNRDVLLTRRDNTLYVHLQKTPIVNRVLLKPLAKQPIRATLLNTGREIETRVDLIPNEHESQASYLRLRNLPVNETDNEVLVVKLDFDEDLDV
ncbi:MAG: alpha-L-fucosidase [Phycisphaerae bacterium]|nr:alpha-L-fucosidase [Phycisphaerae bacterium]